MNRNGVAAVLAATALFGALLVAGTLARRGLAPLPLLLGELAVAALACCSATVTGARHFRRGARRHTAPATRHRRTSIRPTLLLVDRTDPYTLTIRRLGPRTRLLASLHAHALDRQLARRTSPDSSALLSVRATQLQSVNHRRGLASGYRRRLTASRRDPHPTDIPLARAEVRACADLIEEVADLLEAGGPTEAAAVAQAGLLLSDPTSPIYVKGRDEELHEALRRVIAHLQTPPEETEIQNRP